MILLRSHWGEAAGDSLCPWGVIRGDDVCPLFTNGLLSIFILLPFSLGWALNLQLPAGIMKIPSPTPGESNGGHISGFISITHATSRLPFLR